MIFSLLKVRKKTSATLAGIAIGAACLWGLSLWQEISLAELFNILIGTVLLLGGVMFFALLVICALKAGQYYIRLLSNRLDN